MALDFQSRLTEDQRSLLSDFAAEEVAKVEARTKRLQFLATKNAAYRDRLDALQTEDLKYISSVSEDEASANESLSQQKTLAAFQSQTSTALAGSVETSPPEVAHYTSPSVSAYVDDVKNPLLEAIKGRFERLEYQIRRAADRTEVMELRAAKQSTLQADLDRALGKIEASARE